MSDAISSFGTLLQRGDGGSPETFVTIAEVKDITPPSLELGTEEVTSHGSPGGWREHVGTLLDAGEVEAELNFVPSNTGHQALIEDMKNRVERNFRIVFPNGSVWEFAALVTKFEPEAPVDGVLTASVTLKVTGQPTFTW